MVSRNRKIARRIGQAVANDVLDITGAISAGAGVTVYATVDDLPTTGLTAGDEAFISGSNRLYISNGTGWYSIGLINTNPAITSVQDPSTNTTPFTLATDGSALVLTITAADPEGFPLTYNYAVTTGSLTNGGGTTATVGQGTGEGYAIASASILSGTYTIGAYAAALTFKPDGTKMYHVGTNNDRVQQYDLSTAWDVSTATYDDNFSVQSQVLNLTDVKFNTDGTKMFVADRAGTTDNTIYQYSLSTAWDITTATYANKSYDFSAVLTSDELSCFVFNNDGSAVYLTELGPDRSVFQFALSTPFDISTASYSNKSLSLSSVASNGYIGRQYFQFTNDGTKLFLIHTFHPAGFVGKIYEFSLTTAYDISTASYTNVNYTPSGITTGRSAIAFKPDGSKMFILGTDNHTTISQFNLPIYSANQFIITPTATEAYAGTFELTFTASDGINQASSVNSFTLNFITTITNSKYTTLLATATGTSDNNDITDASTNNHSITVTGDTHAGTFSPYRSGGYSVYLPAINGGSEHNISFDHDAGFNFGSGDFTIEFSVYFPSNSTATDYLFQHGESTGSWNVNTYNGVVNLFLNGISIGNDVLADSSNTISNNLNKWIYYAIVRSGTTVTMYRNGTSIATKTSAQNANVGATLDTTNAEYLHINRRRAGIGDGTEFYFKDFRVTKGLARTITAITEPLTSDVNTSILVGNLPYIGDASSNSHTATYIGSPSIKPISLYDYNEYSAADHGGSVYFDGTGDYLQTANPLSLSGDFTVSAWVYPEGASKVQVIASPNLSPNNQFFIDTNNAIGTYDGNSTNTAQGVSVVRNAWNYLVWSRTGSTLNMYVNGQQSSNSFSSTNTYNLQSIGILRTSNDPMQGYISDLQVKTTSTSAANAAPPTAPLSSTGTELHIKGTDASIIDKSQGASLKLIGNTTGSTTQVKFASTKSMYFDGTGDDIRFDTISLTGDFTLEYWIKLSTYNSDAGVFGYTGTTNSQHRINHNGTLGKIMLYVNAYVHQTTGCFTQSEAEDWMHIAYSRQGENLKLYVNGIQKDAVTATLTLDVDILGAGGNAGGNNHLNGYLQDFRITKGLARYTANFTPPTAPLEG